MLYVYIIQITVNENLKLKFYLLNVRLNYFRQRILKQHQQKKQQRDNIYVRIIAASASVSNKSY